MRGTGLARPSRIEPVSVILLAVLTWIGAGAAHAERIRTFVPEKPWSASIDLQDFEPDSVLSPKDILGGETRDGVVVTILVEEEDSAITPAEARAKYAGPTTAKGEETTLTLADTSEMAVVFEPWDAAGGTMTKVNGFVVKEDRSFDIHLSVDLAVHPKEKVLEILKSFQIDVSSELPDMQSLAGKLEGTLTSGDQAALLKDFVKKYPSNSWGYALLGEHYFAEEQRDQAKPAYASALKNHKTQPLVNPLLLWTCYDRLGMCYGMSGDYAASKSCLELGYAVAEELEEDAMIGDSAYNLACWYAETGDTAKCLEFLKKAIESVPDKKDRAREDSSFNKLRENTAFKALVGP